jgi:sulfur-carrier protein
LKVTVRFFTHLREIVGKIDETLEFRPNEKVKVCKILQILARLYGREFEDYLFDTKTGKVKGYLQLLVNGRNVTNAEDLETELEDGDVLSIIPPVGGG